MTLTPHEARVIDFCQRRPVVRLAQLCAQFHLAPITIHRALKKHGYFSSINHNARFYTLANKPCFAEDGLWFYRSIAFSCHRTLPKTLVALVEQAGAGATPEELAQILRTAVHNLLASLARQQQLARRRLGHRVIYLSSDPQRQEQQWQQRQQTGTAPLVPAVLPDKVSLPLALSFLVELIRSPHASLTSLVRPLRNKGLSLQLHQAQAMMDHFQLEKKEAHCNSRNSFRNCFAPGKSTCRPWRHFPRMPCTPSTNWPSRPGPVRNCRR
jgi:hypothetical protein